MKPCDSKRGTAMVESAVVLPLVIMTVAVIVYILIFMHQQVSIRSKMHLALSSEGGKASDTVRTLRTESPRFPVYKSGKSKMGTVYYEGTVSFVKRGLLSRTYAENQNGHKYFIREVDLIRVVDMIKKRQHYAKK